MRRRSPWLFLLLSGFAGAEESSGDSAAALLEVRLETSRGASSKLERFAHRPLVVFYEDRGSSQENERLKEALFALGKARGKLEAVSVVGVANLAAWNWVPARQFAQMGVADAEKKAGVPVLIDWQGALTRAPVELSAHRSTVLLVYREAVLFRHAGALGPSDSERFFSVLSAILDAPQHAR